MDWLNKDELKIAKLDQFVQELKDATSPKDKKVVYDEFESVIKTINAIDLFFLDAYQEEKEVSIIRETAHKYFNVFYKGLARLDHVYEHRLFDLLLQENEKIEEFLTSLKPDIKEMNYSKELLDSFYKCLEFNKKFAKYENVIFPNIEDKIPSTKPLAPS